MLQQHYKKNKKVRGQLKVDRFGPLGPFDGKNKVCEEQKKVYLYDFFLFKLFVFINIHFPLMIKKLMFVGDFL